jgi:hypothetical protein
MSSGTNILAKSDGDEPTSLVVIRLIEILGSRLCAVIGDVEQTSTVREWAQGSEPTAERARSLRFSLEVAKSIEQRYGRATAQSWFQGANHVLSDQAPALVLKRASRAGDVDALRAERDITRALLMMLDT